MEPPDQAGGDVGLGHVVVAVDHASMEPPDQAGGDRGDGTWAGTTSTGLQWSRLTRQAET